MGQTERPIRVLQVLRGGYICGGIENFVMNYYRHIDRTRVQFDFLVHSREKGYYDDEIRNLGGKIYYFSLLDDKNVPRYIWELFCFFREHREYKIVHGQMRGFAPVYFTVAALCGVPVRISHSHASSVEPTAMGGMLEFVVRTIKYPANVHWACSQLAGKYMYGKGKAFEIIPNAISLERFCPKLDVREAMRKELNIEGQFVVGNIGRYCLQKNQKFLLHIFRELLEIRPQSVLVLIGEGKLEEELRSESERHGIADKVLFHSPQASIEDFYQAMDAFVLPSVFEGFPLVLMEAQACGLPCVTSTEVTTEVDISGKTIFLPLDAAPAVWADAIANARWDAAVNADVLKKEYDIALAAGALADRYEILSEYLVKGAIEE